MYLTCKAEVEHQQHLLLATIVFALELSISNKTEAKTKDA